MTQPGIEPRSPGPLANTLPTRPQQKDSSKLTIKSNLIMIHDIFYRGQKIVWYATEQCIQNIHGPH